MWGWADIQDLDSGAMERDLLNPTNDLSFPIITTTHLWESLSLPQNTSVVSRACPVKDTDIYTLSGMKTIGNSGFVLQGFIVIWGGQLCVNETEVSAQTRLK